MKQAQALITVKLHC